MSFFITKKQKHSIKERRKKKVLAEKGLLPTDDERLSMKKRSRSDEINDTVNEEIEKERHHHALELPNLKKSDHRSKTITITVPANLSLKEAKKFRKDSRRKVRMEQKGDVLNDAEIHFLVEGADVPPPPPSKKPKRLYPCINDLIRQQEEIKTQSVQQLYEDELEDKHKKKYVALDCEMVGIGPNGRQSALARVSIVDWDGETLLDTFVQVPMKVTDYRTSVSGVKPKHIQKNAAMDVTTCRTTVANIIKDKILVGHALKNDLDALMLQHPATDIRDTAKYRPFQRLSTNKTLKWRPRKLRDLVLEHCSITIQQQGMAHDSVEDAKATMALFRSVHQSWEKEIDLQAMIKDKSK
jgi:RNA exonuclease 4